MRILFVVICLLFGFSTFADLTADGGEEQSNPIISAANIPNVSENLLATLRCDAREVEAKNVNPKETCQSSQWLVDRIQEATPEQRQKLASNIEDSIDARIRCLHICNTKYADNPKAAADCIVACY